MGDQWTSVIAVISLIVSVFVFGWTIYRDLQTPKFRVSVSVKRIYTHGGEPSKSFISVDAVNFGPIPNRAIMVYLKKNWWIRKVLREDGSDAVLYPDYVHQATSPQSVLSEQIKVGDTASFSFPYDTKCFLSENFVAVGVADGFGRIHWCNKNKLKKLRKRFLDDFAKGLIPKGAELETPKL